ncbi:exonuclease 1 isoform X1 [Salvelinus fontinalis]|uniref:exonuclease 1 isoform X1 n=1 Tax=Salvelinus fontinalis TaxID=8038 RepID=UPI0024867457|nr:exonuclease 1 isoform X1 [Salvelinus fontinalis]XP_055758217.1 exonuclease 1 isoform X1 [Salvelinus fontinalis]XP_055758218.1 exonuclease 1 isoform X1 [Salvelinus fontinalis]
MGIQGLLQFLKDASEPISVRKYKGQTVAVDTYCWLHKGAFSCAEKLAKGEPTDQYVTYCMKFVDMLLSFGVKPILVFDGCNLPSKQEVDKARRERRQANLQKGKQLLREGKISEARDCFTRCVNVTPSMAHDVIKAARTRGVDCVVAPYEADAQLAFLNKAGIAQAIITEDSDLLAFGCKKVILKMDKQGNGLEIDQNHLGRCRSLGDVFTEEKFRHMCILSGCDYLSSLYGIGLGKACKLLRMANNPDIIKVIRKMGQYLKMNVVVPDEYIDGFVKANNTFLYQLVFDPIKRKVVPLNPYPEHMDPATLSYAGRNLGDCKGLQVALGNLDINTMERIDDFNPDATNVKPVKPRSRDWNDSQETRASTHPSIWSRGYIPGTLSASQPVGSPQRPPSTRGKERVISVQGLRLPHKNTQVKRPREDSGVSDQDVLQQYSPSGQKRSRGEEDPGPTESHHISTCPRPSATAAATHPRPRNRFATLLQRRNQEGGGDGQGMQSRFFCSGSSSSEVASQNPEYFVKGEVSQDEVTENPREDYCIGEYAETEENDSVDPHSPPPSHLSASQGLGVFRWSCSSSERSRTPTPTSGLSALQQFQRKKESFSWSQEGQRTRKTPGAPSPILGKEDKDSPPNSPPSQDSAYFSQHNHTSCNVMEVSPPTRLEDATRPKIYSSKDSDSVKSLTYSPTADEKKSSTMRPKVAGLPRMKPGDQGKGTKIRPSAPARASGLRKKPAGPGKKLTTNNENNPGLQATISGLWKNFGFKKENPKINPCKKGEPMSPVKDNMLAFTHETDKDIYFISSVQKTVCL